MTDARVTTLPQFPVESAREVSEYIAWRKQEMLRLRFEEKLPIREIGERFEISRERVRQIVGNSGKRNGGFNYGSALVHADEIVASTDKTNTELAEIFGVSEDTICKYRKGTRHAVKSGDSPVSIGAEWEEWFSSALSNMGIQNELMPHRHPFDILVSGRVRVDVKAAQSPLTCPSISRIKSPVWNFQVGRRNKRGDTDFYACIIIPTKDVFIIPSVIVPTSRGHIRFCWPKQNRSKSIWQSYLNRYDLITDFTPQEA